MLGEIEARMRAGRLGPGELATLLEDALAVQAGRSRLWGDLAADRSRSWPPR